MGRQLGATLRTPHAPHPRAAPPGGFFADVVKNVSVPNLELKKLIYMYLVRHAGEQPDLALLSVNSFQRDLSDQNPLIRALALRVMSSIRLPIIQPIVLMAVQKCAKVGWARLQPPEPGRAKLPAHRTLFFVSRRPSPRAGRLGARAQDGRDGATQAHAGAWQRGRGRGGGGGRGDRGPRARGGAG